METGLLKSEEIFGKPKVGTVGSLFGGGWEIPGVDIKEEVIKTSADIFGDESEESKFQKAYKEYATKQGLSLDPDDPRHCYDYRGCYKKYGLGVDKYGHLPSEFKTEGNPRTIVDGVNTITGEPVPKLEDMKVQENNITAMGKTYTDLGQSLDADYEVYIKLTEELDKLEESIQEAPPDMQFLLNQKRSGLVAQHNELVDKLKIGTKKYQELYSQLESDSELFNMNVNSYNQYIETQAQTQVEDLPEYIKESDAKDVFDAFRLGSSGIFHNTKQYFNAALPNLIYAEVPKGKMLYQGMGLPDIEMKEEDIEKVNEINKVKRETYKEKYQKAEEQYYKWLEDHPELNPRPEWSKGVLETVKNNPSILKDPAYWCYVAAQSAAFTLGIMGTTLVTTAVTGNPFLGMAAGVGVAYPSQAQDLWQELVDNGATEEQASNLAVPIGAVIAAVEVMGDLPLLATVSKPFKKLLGGNITKMVGKRVATSIAKSGAKTFTKVEIAEIIEEVLQGAIQDATVKTFNEDISILEKIPETILQTAIATTPFSIFGTGADVRSNIQERLKQKIIDNNIKTALKEEVEIPEEPEVKPTPEVKEEVKKFVFPEIDIIDLGPLAGVASDEGNRIGLDDKKSLKHNLATIGHEVGHCVDNQFNLKNDKEIIAEFNMEADVEAKEMNRREAVAEAIHQIVDKNETVMKQHPKLVEFIEKNIPDLKKQVNTAREDFIEKVKLNEPTTIDPTPTEEKVKVEEKAPEAEGLKAIPKITKTERALLEGAVEAVEGETGKMMPAWILPGTTARAKALTKLEERGYATKEGFLTKKGMELANTLKARIEAEEKGIPLEQREEKRPPTDKQIAKTAPNEELILGKIGDEDYYTDSRIMLKGKPENVPISKNKPDFEQITNKLTEEETKINPVILSHKKDSIEDYNLVWFDNKVSIQEKYYDFVIKKFPEAEFRSVEEIDPENPTPKAPIKIYEKGEFVGVVMPLKIEIENIPVNVLGKKKPKVEEPQALERPTPKEESLFEEKATAKPEEVQELSAKSWQVKLSKEAVIPEKINKTQIMNWAGETFGIPIKSKATHKWKAAGTYYPKQQIIRMEKWGELSVLTHEIAHDTDAKIKRSIGNRWKIPNRVIVKELADLDYDQKQRRTSEGFAEYMRHRLTTGMAKEKAPVFDTYFNEKILSKNPDLKKNLDTFKEKLDVWNKQGAENRIIQHIDWKGEHTKTRGIGAKLYKFLEWVNVRFNDEFYFPQKITKEIEKIIGKELPPRKNPALLMEYSKSKAGAIARTFVTKKAVDEHGNPIGDSLTDVLRPIPKNEMRQFIAYAVSKRAINLSGRGIESGFDVDDAKYIINKYKEKGWDETVNNLTGWSNHVLDWLVRAGGLDKETTQLMRDLNPVYLPFKRAFIDEANVVKGSAGYVDTGKGIKGIKGSGRPIINPLESMVTQMRELIAKAQKIRIAKIFIDLSENEGVGGFITKVPAPMKATTFSANQIRDYLDTLVAKAEGAEGMTAVHGGEYNDFLTVFTQDFKFSGKENIVTIWKDGKQEFYEIHSDLYEAFKGVDPLKLGPVTKIFSHFSRMLRLGATGLKLSFGLARNPFRDAFSYAVFSKRNNTTVFDPIKGYYKEMTTKEGEPTWRFKALGGGLSGQIGLDRASVQNSYDEMLDIRLGAIGKALHVIKHPVNTLADLVSITEMGPRSVEMEAAYKKYTSEKWQKEHPDWTEEDAFIQAFCDAQDVTVNFTKSGKWAKQINQVTAFFNVSIRGPEKLYRSIKERPIQTFVKGTLWLTTIAVASWYRNKDKDWYKNLPPAYKYNNLFFELNGNVYRLPIPFELGIIFMAAPQAVLDTMKDKDSKSLEGLLDLAKAQIPNPTPSVFQPALSVAKNKNYLGVPIESEGMQYLYPTERKRDYTTKLAVALSKGMDKIGIQLSPIQLDYMLDSYSGGFLRQFRITGEELSDYPVIGDLMLRDPSYPKRQLNEYFSDWELLRQKKQSGIATRAEIKELNRIDGFYKTYKVLQGNITKAKKANNQALVVKYSNLLRERLERYGYN